MPGSLDSARWYRGKHTVVTGGLGFIGSNLALELWRAGSRVTVIDSLVPGCGGCLSNLAPASRQIEVLRADISDEAAVASALQRADLIFNLAGEVSHSHSMLFPERDLCINTTSHLRFLEACAHHAPGRRVVYAGTRQVYGVPNSLPVAETHPVNPVDFNGVHKHAAEQYHLLLTRTGRIDGIILRFTNVYGPRMGINLSCQGVLSVFFRQALQSKPLTVFGDGSQVRDPIYVADACDALLRAGIVVNPAGRTINIGYGSPLSLLEIACEISRRADLKKPHLAEFPPERCGIDIGSYVSSGIASSEILGWRPRTSFNEGVGLTFEYYRSHWPEWSQRIHSSPGCPLHNQVLAARSA